MTEEEMVESWNTRAEPKTVAVNTWHMHDWPEPDQWQGECPKCHRRYSGPKNAPHCYTCEQLVEIERLRDLVRLGADYAAECRLYHRKHLVNIGEPLCVPDNRTVRIENDIREMATALKGTQP